MGLAAGRPAARLGKVGEAVDRPASLYSLKALDSCFLDSRCGKGFRLTPHSLGNHPTLPPHQGNLPWATFSLLQGVKISKRLAPSQDAPHRKNLVVRSYVFF